MTQLNRRDVCTVTNYTYYQTNLLKTLDATRNYRYTADGERIAAWDGTKLTFTLRGLDNKVLRVFDLTGSTWTWVKDYVYRGGLHLAEVESGYPTEPRHFSLDHLGTIRLITKNTGTYVNYHAYYGFGEEAGTTADGAVMKFTGHERDLQGTITTPTDDLDYLHARYYNFNIARFLSTDPITDVKRALKAPQLWNKYAYVANNPVNFNDPTGMLLKVAFSKEEDWTKVAKEVYAKTGLTLGIKDGVVSVLGDAYAAGARKNVSGVARSIVLEAINSKDTFSVSLARSDSNVTLGVARGPNVKLDMTDLRSLTSTNVDARTMDASMTLFHELLHSVRGTDDVRFHSDPGQTVSIVNLIRDKLGLPERTSYYYTPVGPNSGELHFQGGALTFTNY